MKALYIALLFVFSVPFLGNAQDEYQENLPNIIKMRPVQFAFGNFNFSYERALSKSTSLEFGANYWYRFLDNDVNGVGVRASFRFYITNRVKSSPEGFYVGPIVSYNWLNNRGDEDITASVLGAGGIIGYQWVWKSGVTLDLGLGPIIAFATSSEGERYDGVIPNIYAAIGYNF